MTGDLRLHYEDLAAPATKVGCAKTFVRHPGPILIAAAAAGTITSRLRLGRFRTADVGVAAGLVLAHPVAEWALHIYVLHRSRTGPDGQRRETFAARTHRQHHEDPKDVDLVLLPTEVTAGIVGATVAIGLALPDRRRGLTSSSVTLLSLLAYEWMHLLIHSPYRPKSRWYRSRWRAHRLHHYRNENYWFGVVATAADRMFGTAPQRDEVPVSATALTLKG